MKLSIGSDHRGFQAKERMKAFLAELGHEAIDCGTDSTKPCDYPDIAYPAAKAVADGKAELGILLCGSGIGMSIAANKVRGVRAALCHDEVSVDLARRHNDARILCLSADGLGEKQMTKIIRIFLETSFDAGRHERRVNKVTNIENGKAPG
ncbi:MAG: ribose 5-phosphate isomerase B [Actinobacteria bacterium]|nr:ribose 5-phosphate isomerase B [Actinomycetota bacterium]